jgi:hypothetical protein
MPFRPVRSAPAGLAHVIAPALLLTSSAAAQPSCPGPLFESPARGVAGTPSVLAVGDLNGDGNLDAIVVIADSGTAEVLLGDGAGQFEPSATTLGLGTNPVTGTALADFDADGDLDAVFSGEGPLNNVTFWLNDGQGAFLLVSSASAPGGVAHLAVDNLAGDARIEIALARPSLNIVEVYRVDTSPGGAIALGPKIGQASVAMFNPVRLATGDTTGDGRPELGVLSQNPGELYLFQPIDLGPSLAAFNTINGFLVEGQPTGLLIDDLNADGRNDLVAASETGFGFARAEVWANLTSGWESVQAYGGGSFAFRGLAAADLNEDADKELILANSEQLFVYSGTGPGVIRSGVLPAAITDLAVLDANADGVPDIVAAFTPRGFGSLDRGGVVTFRGVGAPEVFAIPGPPGFNVNVPSPEALAADFDADGDPDLATLGLIGASIWTNTGSGLSVPTGQDSSSGWTGLAADLSGDGSPDAAFAIPFTDQIRVALNNGTGVLNNQATFSMPGGPASLIAAADMDDDDDLDLVVAGNDRIGVMINWNGVGGFDPPITVSIASALPSGPIESIALSHVNADPLPDVVFAAGGRLYWIANLGGGQLDSSLFGISEITDAVGAVGVAAVDLDADGADDLLVADGSSIARAIGRRPGSGASFTPLGTIPLAGPATGVHLRDINLNGLSDAIFTNGTSDQRTPILSVVLRSPPTGIFSPLDELLAPARGFLAARGSPAVADFDLDADVDLAGPFALRGLGCQAAVCTADLTGDGQVDSGDLEAFILAFLAGDADTADLTGDGQVDSGDLEAFINAFLAGCDDA